jgi:hypothetical protein
MHTTPQRDLRSGPAPVGADECPLADRLTERDPVAVYAGSNVATKLKVMSIELAVMSDAER